MATPNTPVFRGAYTAIATPFTADAARLDLARLEQQIALQAKGGVAGIVVSGTTGESPTLGHEEYETLVREGVRLGHRHGLTVLAGTGSNSTAHAVAMQKFAKQAGADATLSVNPYYNRPTQDGLYRHFMAVADAADIPVMLYNIPGRAAVGLSLETIQKLSRHPNIRAVKDATGNVEMASDLGATCPGLAVLSGDDPLTLPIAAVGGVGVVSVASNVVPDRVSALCRAFLEGRWAEALAEHRALLPLIKALFAETNPVPLKAAMALLGRDTGSLRLPMSGAQPATVERLKAALTGLELL